MCLSDHEEQDRCEKLAVAIYATLGVRLRAFFRCHSIQAADADDLIQETVRAAVKGYDPGIGPLENYIFVIANNLRRNFHKKEERRKRFEAELKKIRDYRSIDPATAKELEKLREAHRELPESRTKTAGELRQEGCTLQEIAEQLGISVTAAHFLCKAYQTLIFKDLG